MKVHSRCKQQVSRLLTVFCWTEHGWLDSDEACLLQICVTAVKGLQPVEVPSQPPFTVHYPYATQYCHWDCHSIPHLTPSVDTWAIKNTVCCSILFIEYKEKGGMAYRHLKLQRNETKLSTCIHTELHAYITYIFTQVYCQMLSFKTYHRNVSTVNVRSQIHVKQVWSIHRKKQFTTQIYSYKYQQRPWSCILHVYSLFSEN